MIDSPQETQPRKPWELGGKAVHFRMHFYARKELSLIHI